MKVFINASGCYYAAEQARSIADSEVVSPSPLLIRTLTELHKQQVEFVKISDAEALLYKFRNMSPEELEQNFTKEEDPAVVEEQK